MKKIEIILPFQSVAISGIITKTNQIDEINRFNGIFIRAPGIVSIDDREQVKVLATLANDSGNTQKPSSANGTCILIIP